MPLNVTVLEPCVEPKLFPEIVTTVPIAPKFGDRLVIRRSLRANRESEPPSRSLLRQP